jgi:hypothetical protein
MADQWSQLPWEALWGLPDQIPWDAMNTFVQAVVTDPGVADELVAAYDESRQMAETEPTCMDFYVPAIFAMAAPQLSDEQRRRIGGALVERLVEAGRARDDLDEEALEAACGAMGPAILPAVLDAIEREPDPEGAWFSLWHLTELAVGADVETRRKVEQACVAVLEKVDREEAESDVGIGAAWTLAWLQRTEYADLLDRLSRNSVWYLGGADYKEAANILRGKPRPAESGRLWEQPVHKWLEPTWKYVKDWFSRPHQKLLAVSEEDAAAGMADLAGTPDQAFTPPIPIVNVSPKIGRNEPCPCGSGKKYKKCCGRATQDHAESVS